MFLTYCTCCLLYFYGLDPDLSQIVALLHIQLPLRDKEKFADLPSANVPT